MDNFAFVTHPFNESEFFEKHFPLRLIPRFLAPIAMKFCSPYTLSEIQGVASKYNRIIGNVISCPVTASMLNDNYIRNIKKIISSGILAKKLGAKIIGLGSQLAVKDGLAEIIAKEAGIPVTNGNSYRILAVIEAIRIVASNQGRKLENLNVAVVGTTGTFASSCAVTLARDLRNMLLVGSDEKKTEQLARRVLYESGLVTKTSNTKSSLIDADIILIASDNFQDFSLEDVKSGAVIFNNFRANMLWPNQAKRGDITIIEKVFADVPGEIISSRKNRYNAGVIDAEMVEPMLLALEKKYHSYSSKSDIKIKMVDEIGRLAKKHGFKVSGYLANMNYQGIKKGISGNIIVSGTT